MGNVTWYASSLRNWLLFRNAIYPLKVGVHCANLGSVCYEIDGNTSTLLLNGKELPGATVSFSAAGQSKELLEGERALWKWTLSQGVIELHHRPSGRRVSLNPGHCLIQDHRTTKRLLSARFLTSEEVTFTASEGTHEAPAPQTVPASHAQPERAAPVAHWTDAIPDEGIRLVLKHLERHGTINENEVTELLDSPRLARAFGNKLDQYRATIPFVVQVDATATSGPKVYRKL